LGPITLSTLSWASSALDEIIDNTFNAAVCPAANQMCMGTTTFDEPLCVDPAAVCGIEIVSQATSCNNDGTYNLDVCFNHTPGATAHVEIDVFGTVVLSNFATAATGSGCVSIPSAGIGDGSNVTVTITEAFSSSDPIVGISEIHYDNDGTDTEEGIEVFGLDGVNLQGYEVYLYNGNGGVVYGPSPIALSGIFGDEGAGCDALSIPISGLQNGNDGFAIVDPTGAVIQFISYEGSFMATNGPATGMLAVDVGVEQSTTDVGTSLQLTDAGWVRSTARSFGTMNTNLSCPIASVAPVCSSGFEIVTPICEVECGNLACNNKIQVSLGADCEQCITPDMVLEGSYPISYDNYNVVIMDANGDVLEPETNCVGLEHAGMELYAKVECGGNACWGTLVVEDKLPPQIINCAEIQAALPSSISCADLNEEWEILVDLPDSVIVECNEDFTVTTESGLRGEMCTDDYRWSKIYIIDYPQAHSGRDTSHACIVSVPVVSIGLDDIICPDDQELDCRMSDFTADGIFNYWVDPMDGDTTSAFALTQAYPYLLRREGGEIVDTVRLTSEHCNILSNYADTEIPICQFQRKILRKWTFIDWCTSQVRTCDQVLKLTKDDRMICVAPPDFDVPLGAHCLTEPFELPTTVDGADMVIFSGCGNVVDTTIFFKAKAANREAINDSPFVEKAIKNSDGTFTLPETAAPFDSIWLKYEFTNACGVTCEAFTEARVIDDTPPTPICNPDLGVAFTDLERGDDGLMKIYAEAFDNGSHDNDCGEVFFKIVRMEELNNSLDGYWNNSGLHGQPDYTLPPITNRRSFCGGANGDDFGDLILNGNQLVATGDQFWFDDHMKLCCTDESFMVVMRVFDVDPGAGPVDPRRMHTEPTVIAGTTDTIQNDLFGRFNDCMIELNVQDKTQILGACLPFSLYCDEYPDNPMDNAPQINMLCSDDSVNLISRDSINIGDCGNGLVIRDWYANRSGGEDIKVCTQSIVIQSRAFNPYSIQWPKSYIDGEQPGRHLYLDATGSCLDSVIQVPMGGDLDCADGINSCDPTWDNTACSLIGLSSVDDTLFVNSNACMKIIRTWNVIDWCLYNENIGSDNNNQ